MKAVMPADTAEKPMAANRAYRPKGWASLLLLLTLSPVAGAVEHTQDSPQKIQENLAQEKAVLIDVRTDEEWRDGHLAGTAHLPLGDLADGADKRKLAEKLPDGKIIYCHCKAGVRALMAAKLLHAFGYNVRPLEQGYKELLELGFPQAP